METTKQYKKVVAQQHKYNKDLLKHKPKQQQKSKNLKKYNIYQILTGSYIVIPIKNKPIVKDNNKYKVLTYGLDNTNKKIIKVVIENIKAYSKSDAIKKYKQIYRKTQSHQGKKLFITKLKNEINQHKKELEATKTKLNTILNMNNEYRELLEPKPKLVKRTTNKTIKQKTKGKAIQNLNDIKNDFAKVKPIKNKTLLDQQKELLLKLKQ